MIVQLRSKLLSQQYYQYHRHLQLASSHLHLHLHLHLHVDGTVIFSSLHRLLSTFPPWSKHSPPTDAASKILHTLRLHSPPDSEEPIPASDQNKTETETEVVIPGATRQFLTEYGLTEQQIKSVISRDPRIAHTHVDQCMKPRIKELQEMGFSPSDVTRVIVLSPISLRLGSMGHNVRFWLSILGSVENLLKALRRNMFLLTCNVEKLVQPNISFLNESCGLSSSDIHHILLSKPWVIVSYPYRLKEVVQRADLLGIPRGTRRFRDALGILFRTDQEEVHSKIELLRSLGWSEDEVGSMIAKHPDLLAFSKKNIRQTVGFLTKEFGLGLEVIAWDPYLIQLSVDKRLKPRYNVVKILESKGLLLGRVGFKAVAYMSDKIFREKFIDPYKGDIPGFSEEYDAACAGKMSEKKANFSM